MGLFDSHYKGDAYTATKISERWIQHFIELLPSHINDMPVGNSLQVRARKNEAKQHVESLIAEGFIESRPEIVSFRTKGYTEFGGRYVNAVQREESVLVVEPDTLKLYEQSHSAKTAEEPDNKLKPINLSGNPDLQRQAIMEEVRRRCIPNPTNLAKGEKASISRYFDNAHGISESVFEDRYRELKGAGKLGSAHKTLKDR